jgi:hypothetical protein
MTLDTYVHSFEDAADNNAERMGQVFALVSRAANRGWGSGLLPEAPGS